ncbi:MAG: DUF1844 domain-containing protein [Actinobacteria bacterium]|nr:DUF1844 domain-containing protein [Actinomycetota bacterium]
MTEEEREEKDPDQMSEEELRARLEKHFREQKVDEMLVQFLVSLSNLAYIKMGLTEETGEVKDLDQASLAIDAFKGLLDAAGKRLPEQEASALAGALSSMQITFVKVSAPEAAEPAPSEPESSEPAASEPDEPAASEPDEPAPAEPAPESGKPDDDPSSRLWVPGKE